MRYKRPLTKILTNARADWDQAGTRAVVRREFHKVLKCRTAGFGGEVYESDTERKICLPHVQIESVSELWASSDPAMATGTVGRPPRHSLQGHSPYHAQTFSGLSFGRTAICCTTCPRSEPT